MLSPRERTLYHAVLRQTAFWRYALYIINAVVMVFSVTLLGLGIWMRTRPEIEISSPLWLVNLVIAACSIVTVICIVGIVGIYQAPKHIVTDSCNFFMFFYQLSLLVSVVLTIVAAASFFSLLSDLRSLQGAPADGSKTSAVAFEESLKDWMKDHPSKWVSVQDQFHCCGYDKPEDALSTGALCTKPGEENPTDEQLDAKQCKAVLLDAAENKSTIVASVAVTAATFQFLALIASCCVVWRKPQRGPRLASLAE